MNATDAVRTKLEVREFNGKRVPSNVKLAVLEAARLTQSSVNSQHWRFVLVQEPEGIQRLAEASTTGDWISGADFAVIVCTRPGKSIYMFDAGRAVQDMQLTAWDHQVASGLYTGFELAEMRQAFRIPDDLSPVVVLGFGYPRRRLLGKKSRKPLSEIAFLETYGNKLELKDS